MNLNFDPTVYNDDRDKRPIIKDAPKKNVGQKKVVRAQVHRPASNGRDPIYDVPKSVAARLDFNTDSIMLADENGGGNMSNSVVNATDLLDRSAASFPDGPGSARGEKSKSVLEVDVTNNGSVTAAAVKDPEVADVAVGDVNGAAVRSPGGNEVNGAVGKAAACAVIEDERHGESETEGAISTRNGDSDVVGGSADHSGDDDNDDSVSSSSTVVAADEDSRTAKKG